MQKVRRNSVIESNQQIHKHKIILNFVIILTILILIVIMIIITNEIIENHDCYHGNYHLVGDHDFLHKNNIYHYGGLWSPSCHDHNDNYHFLGNPCDGRQYSDIEGRDEQADVRLWICQGCVLNTTIVIILWPPSPQFHQNNWGSNNFWRPMI